MMRGANKIITVLITFIFACAFCIYIASNISFIKVRIDMRFEQASDCQVFFTYGNKKLNEHKSVIQPIHARDDFKIYEFPIHAQRDINVMRFDLGTRSNKIHIRSIQICGLLTSIRFSGDDLDSLLVANENVFKTELKNGILICHTVGPDPSLLYPDCITVFSSTINKYWNKTWAIVLSVLVSFLITYLITRILVKEEVSTSHAFNLIGSYMFLGAIFIPFAIFVFPGMQRLGTFDNRTLAPAPETTIETLFEFPDKFTNFFEDRFGFRNQLIVLNNELKAKIFKLSAIPSRVMIGENGWLFYTGDETGKNYILNEAPFTHMELETIYDVVRDRKNWLDSMGMKYYIMIPPIKATVYKEFLPGPLRGGNELSRLDQILAYINARDSSIVMIDLRPLFTQKKLEKELYYKTDTHWNLYGAYLGYKSLLYSIHKDFPDVSPREESEYKLVDGLRKFDGDLSYMLAIKDDRKRTDIYLHPIKPNRAVLQPRDEKYRHKFHDYKVKLQLPDSVDAPSILVFRDSYTNFLYGLISEHFSTSVYIWSHHFEPEIILEEKPDIVAEVILERYLHEWLDGNNPVIRIGNQNSAPAGE